MNPKKILFIGSDSSLFDPISAILSPEGYEMILSGATSGAMAEIHRTHPDVVVLDVSDPNNNAFDVLELLRSEADTATAATPVIIASENGDLVEISRALKFGIKDYFVKSSFSAEEAAAKIRKHTGQSAPVYINTAVMADPQPQQAAAEVAPAQPARPIKLLIVEDDKFLRDLAVQKFVKENLEVIAAVDGEQGIALAEREIPDVMLLDILLPGIDGYEVLKRVRANPALAQTRVAMFSNFGQRSDIEKAMNAGADQFMVKANYTLDEIVTELKKLLEKPRQ